jgi:diguanylate cyclase (GGDEF)-like protein
MGSTTLRERLSWRITGLPDETGGSEQASMVRALIYLLGMGGLMALVSLPFVPGRGNALGTLAAGVSALLLAGLLLLRFDHVSQFRCELFVASGTLLITAALYFNGHRADDTELIYLWVGLYTFYFFSVRRAAMQAALVGISYGVVLAFTDHTDTASTRWIVTIGTLLVAGVLVRLLKNRVEGLITRLAAAARTDPLTQVLNRRAFLLLFDWELERSRRSGRPLSVLVGDLDRFKQVNDRFGHQAGDDALKRASAVLAEAKRRGDTLARIGGEEFALILPDSDEQGAFVLGERLRCALRDSFASDPVPLTISFGIACSPTHGVDTEALLQAADQALYAAKTLGRDRVLVHGPEVTGVAASEHAADSYALRSERVPLSARGNELAELLPGDERRQVAELLDRDQAVQAVFQPMVALATGHVVGYEALARFPLLHDREPDAWFAQAHRGGLGPALEAASVRAALSRPGRPAGTLLALNVSPSTLGSQEIQDALPQELSGLVLELTEHELISDEEGLLSHLAALRARGALIAVDDAGSAYAGLQQVMRLQPDIIKLDRPLIDGVHARADKAALVDSFVAFAHRTGATVCAEGIETLADLAALADLDVDYGQGFALGRPSEHWGTVPSPVADTLMRRSVQSRSASSAPFDILASADRRLERLCAQLSSVRALDQLDGVTDLIAAELHADGVVCSRWHRADRIMETLSTRRLLPTGERYNLADYLVTERVLTEQIAVQVLSSDPAGDPAELALLALGEYRSLLMVPIVCGGESFGLLEAFSRNERPWSRTSINRARIISYQLGAVLGSLFGVGLSPQSTHLDLRVTEPGT